MFIDEKFLRECSADLPEVTELDVMRYFINLFIKISLLTLVFIPWFLHNEI